MVTKRQYRKRTAFSALRAQEGLSQSAVADRGQVSSATIARFEYGMAQPRLADRRRLAKAYGVDLPHFDRLLAAEDEPS